MRLRMRLQMLSASEMLDVWLRYLGLELVEMVVDSDVSFLEVAGGLPVLRLLWFRRVVTGAVDELLQLLPRRQRRRMSCLIVLLVRLLGMATWKGIMRMWALNLMFIRLISLRSNETPSTTSPVHRHRGAAAAVLVVG